MKTFRKAGTSQSYDVSYVINTVMSFRRAKAIMAANEYDLFTHLTGRALTAGELAKVLRADSRGLGLLLDALVSLHLLSKDGDKYSNTETVDECLVKGRPGYIGDMIKHMNDEWSTWGELEKPIFGGKPDVADWRARFILALDNLAIDKANLLADKVDLDGRKRLLDVGGGSGAYSVAFVKRYHTLTANIFDTQDTLRVTRKLLSEKKVENISTIEGDFEVGELGRGYDAVLVSNIVHFQSEDENKRLFEKCYGALTDGGIMIIHDYILDDDKKGPQAATLFALHMLLNSESGRAYSWGEIEGWLDLAGFERLKRIDLGDSRVITSIKSGD